MKEEEFIKDIHEINSTKEDYYKCIEYEEKIYNGENILIEANLFVNMKMMEIAAKSPEIIVFNKVEKNNNPITNKSVLESLGALKKVLDDELKKEGINFIRKNDENLY